MTPLIGIVTNIFSEDAGTNWDRSDAVPHSYSEAVIAAGGAPVLLPCTAAPTALARMLEPLQGLLVSGGGDFDPQVYGESPVPQMGRISPARDGMDRAVVEYALQRPYLPLLGICRGIQAMNVVAGGTLYQDIPSQLPHALKHSQSAPEWYATHPVRVTPATQLSAIFSGAEEVGTNSFHHQAVRDPAPGFTIAGRALDGIIEVIEKPGARFCIGVQFHPEAMAPRDPTMRKLFEAFVGACGQG